MMKSSNPRGDSVPAAVDVSPSRRIPSVKLQVQIGNGALPGRPRLTSLNTLATRCSSEERMYVSGRPDSKISRTVLAARLSVLLLPEPLGVIFSKTASWRKKSVTASQSDRIGTNIRQREG